MKRALILLLAATAGLAAAVVRRPVVFGMDSRLSLGTRYHPAHSAIEKWPYDGDLSYGVAYALYDGMGYLEAALDYAPEGTAESVIDDVLTPRLNLGIKDGIFVAGIGIADAYVNTKTGGSEWTGLLYQFQLGLDVPLGNSFELGAAAYYSFEAWDELGDFEVEDLEYGVHVGYFF